MTLQTWVAQKKRDIFDDLRQGQMPREGAYDLARVKEGIALGQPQMGTTVFSQRNAEIEFIFSDPKAASLVVTVTLEAPERIVFLPVPKWVVESIWQGEIDGSYQFESDAERQLEELKTSLTQEGNATFFGRQMAKRRE